MLTGQQHDDEGREAARHFSEGSDLAQYFDPLSANAHVAAQCTQSMLQSPELGCFGLLEIRRSRASNFSTTRSKSRSIAERCEENRSSD